MFQFFSCLAMGVTIWVIVFLHVAQSRRRRRSAWFARQNEIRATGNRITKEQEARLMRLLDGVEIER